MHRDAEAPVRYLHRDAAHGAVLARARGTSVGPPRSTARAVDRMQLALRAYEQRFDARARLRLWLLAQLARAEATAA